jgi:hypothetical protein
MPHLCQLNCDGSQTKIAHHLIEFLKERYKTIDFELKKLNLDFMESFELHLPKNKDIRC